MADESIELAFDLLTLPTAQHRAGLAGLLVLAESMRRRRLAPLPKLSHGDTTVRMTLTKTSLAAVLDDFYDAVWEERRSEGKPQGSKIRNIRAVETPDERTGKPRKAYTFETVMPKAEFLVALGLPAAWAKLWRQAVWATLRGIPQTRLPYEERAAGAPATDAARQWAQLRRFEKDRPNGRLHTVDLAGPFFIGAQAVNAERVPFRGLVEEAFLLQFWPVVMSVYVPESIDREGQSRFTGDYVLAVPDVADLVGFVHDFPESLSQLTTDMAGYRPREAVISVPQEGALEYLHHVIGLARARAVDREVGYSLAAVEVYHLGKRGNSIHVLTADRVIPAPDLLQGYGALRARYRDPLFRRQIILNLLRREPWYRGFDRVFAVGLADHFVGAAAGRFATDATRRFGTAMEEGRSA